MNKEETFVEYAKQKRGILWRNSKDRYFLEKEDTKELFRLWMSTSGNIGYYTLGESPRETWNTHFGNR